MSATLCARRKPKANNWTWHFKMTIRDKLRDRFPNGVITPQDVSYLEGLRDAFERKDGDDLQEMIDVLENGDEIEFKVEY